MTFPFANGPAAATPPNAPRPSAVETNAPIQFANGAKPSNGTPVHGFPLPDGGRDFQPTYSGGRYALPDPETGKQSRFTRVTTGAHTLDDTGNLDTWKMSNVVLGLKDKPELLDELDLWDDPQEVRTKTRNIARRASEIAGANEASELGTAIHAWTEAVERDGLALEDVPTRFRPYVTAYMDELARCGITTVPGMVERIVYHSASGWVGTLDRMYQLADGSRVIGDVKTSKSLKYGYLGFSVQLATYANADYMLSLDGTKWEPMPAVSNAFAVIAHVPSNQPGTCKMVTIDLTAGAEALETAVKVRAMRADAGKVIPDQWELPMPSADATPAGPDIFAEIEAATSGQDLYDLYEKYADVWTQEHTDAGQKRAAAFDNS